MKKLVILLFLSLPVLLHATEKIEQWKSFEITFNGPEKGNPYVDVQLQATFKLNDTKLTVDGFYAGNGSYKIRFMPDQIGAWTFITESNVKKLHGKKGQLECIKSSEGNHGKVEVEKTLHFKYSDGSPYYPFGTTCYAWTHQADSIQELTLKTLASSPFNKLRMCVFPKHMEWMDLKDPAEFPYARKENGEWNHFSFNQAYFDNLEKRILELDALGIECDLILFHPYDKGRWGFDSMTDEEDDFYLKYILARLSSFKNIWWSVANEFDIMENKTTDDWDRFFKIIVENDPYNHLRSIHNCNGFYDHTKPWVSHVSAQQFTWDTRKWIEKYQKPVVVDECRYEGDLKFTWGDLTPEAMTQQFWDAITRGGYASHGETYKLKSDQIWWAEGGVLLGESVARIAFLKEIIESTPRNGLTSFIGSPIKWNRRNSVRLDDDYLLFYFGERQPIERDLVLPSDKKYKIEIIDTWNMTITEADGTYSGICTVQLPGKPYIALRATIIK